MVASKTAKWNNLTFVLVFYCWLWASKYQLGDPRFHLHILSSRDRGPTFGVLCSRSHLNILRSRVLLMGVPGPGSQVDLLGSQVQGPGVLPVDVAGPGSHFSVMSFWYTTKPAYQQKKNCLLILICFPRICVKVKDKICRFLFLYRSSVKNKKRFFLIIQLRAIHLWLLV